MKIGDENIERIVFERTKELLTKYGIKGWNMDDLARESGMSKRTLYKIIGNKEDLLYKCYHEDFKIKAATHKAFFAQDLSYFELLDNLSEQTINGVDEYIIAASKSLKNEYPNIAVMVEREIKAHHDMLKNFFIKGKELGLLKDDVSPELIINFINALMHYNIFNSKDKSEFVLMIKEELDFLFKAIRK